MHARITDDFSYGLTGLSRPEIAQRINILNQTSPVSVAVLDRYPSHDHRNFPLDSNWSAFGFPDGYAISATPVAPQCFFAVMTQADGTQLYAAYLTFSELVTNPSADQRYVVYRYDQQLDHVAMMLSRYQVRCY